MIEALLPVAAAAPWVVAWLGMRSQRDLYRRGLEAEAAKVEKLQTLLMAREAPAEYAAYIEPQSLVEDFPEDAVWDESGLFYVSASEGE